MKPKDMATGLDGVHYAAYRALPEASAKVLAATTSDLSEPAPQTDLLDFNRQLVWLGPEGSADQDGVAVIRAPGNLRTIFGSHTYAKSIAGGIA